MPKDKNPVRFRAAALRFYVERAPEAADTSLQLRDRALPVMWTSALAVVLMALVIWSWPVQERMRVEVRRMTPPGQMEVVATDRSRRLEVGTGVRATNAAGVSLTGAVLAVESQVGARPLLRLQLLGTSGANVGLLPEGTGLDLAVGCRRLASFLPGIGSLVPPCGEMR
jgi:hypothetical protein